MKLEPNRLYRIVGAALLCLMALPSFSRPQIPSSTGPEIPENFRFDLEAAAKLRRTLLPQSGAPIRFATGRGVFERLIAQEPHSPGLPLAWELRITNEDLLNAYSSPDGTIYVGRKLAQLAGQNAGLWAAILSHEMAHVVRRDWARRYLYEKSFQSGAALTLGDPGLPSSTWTDSRTASEELARFCRQLEIDADSESLMWMARAGYHPDFVPALHHLIHVHSAGRAVSSANAMHPCWQARDRQLERAYVVASSEFDHLWPERYLSPGGNPPVVVFADEPTVKKSAGEWQVQIPMRCQNLAGTVEVVLLTHRANDATSASLSTANSATNRQLTGCTSPRTTIVFPLIAPLPHESASADIYVLDIQGAVLSRAEVPRLR